MRICTILYGLACRVEINLDKLYIAPHILHEIFIDRPSLEWKLYSESEDVL